MPPGVTRRRHDGMRGRRGGHRRLTGYVAILDDYSFVHYGGDKIDCCRGSRRQRKPRRPPSTAAKQQSQGMSAQRRRSQFRDCGDGSELPQAWYP
jgi:hypothetical protein